MGPLGDEHGDDAGGRRALTSQPLPLSGIRVIDISNLFGYADFPFAGSAVLEALGWGVEVPAAAVVTHAALRNLTPAIT